MNSQTEGACQGLINRLKSVITSESFKARHRQRAQDFTRKRCLSFVIVILFLLNSLKRAAQDELDEFFRMLNGDDIAVRIVTKSAFFQARKKLKYEAFIELNDGTYLQKRQFQLIQSYLLHSQQQLGLLLFLEKKYY